MALGALGLIAAAPPPFRIAVPAQATGPCTAPSPSAPAGERAYFDLLNRRMGRAVLACPVASPRDAADALAAGKLDMAVLDPATYPAVRTSTRAAMTVRAQGGLARIAVVLATRAGKPGDAASLKGRPVAFGGRSPAALALPQQVLAEQGYAVRDLVADDEAGALSAVRSGRADAVVLEAAAWQRQCQATGRQSPCADLTVVWRARPQAQHALVVRRDLPDPVRFRLLGVHVAMHMEDRPAFDWAATQLAPDAADFEPAEAQALDVARLK